LPMGRPQGMRMLDLPDPGASVLVIITDQDSPSAMRATGALVERSARSGERIVILSAQSGAILVSSQAPSAPGQQVSAPPAPLAPHSTSFQKARHAQAIQNYQSMLLLDRAALQRQEQEMVTAWAKSIVAKVEAAIVPQGTHDMNVSADLGAAASDLSSLRQAGEGYSPGTVIAVVGINAATARLTPTSLTGLQGSTVVVDGFPGNTDEQAAWQASLLQGGAARAVLLTPATQDQFVPVVQQGLDGAVTDTLTSVLFALGQYRLQTEALPQMRQLLHLLTVVYPRATASIDGYTDNLPAPGGNLRLSQLRAQEVEQWLIAHGVATGRLQAFGYGDSNPVAPNAPAGQPLNRRVVVVIDPAALARYRAAPARRVRSNPPSDAPGPGTAVTARALRDSPQYEQTGTAVTMCPQALCVI
jgi:outer membrane protein OmpA-like peptidoglycan-associated protein